MLDQITDNRSPSLAARAGDYELHGREAYEDAGHADPVADLTINCRLD